jgi:hypothetical protein
VLMRLPEAKRAIDVSKLLFCAETEASAFRAPTFVFTERAIFFS